MFRLYQVLKLINVFWREKRRFEVAARFYFMVLPEGDERDKKLGEAYMSVEQANAKLVGAKKLLKDYVKNSWRDGYWAPREVPEEKSAGTKKAK